MARTHRPAVVLALAVALVATGCSAPSRESTPDEAAPVASRPPGQWRACPEVAKEVVGRTAPDMTYECMTITVPRDWGTAETGESGKTFDIALLRARSTRQKDRIGSLIVNPGGPGGSGIDLAVGLSFGPQFGQLPDEVIRRFDIVGFDPRGVGRSSPVKCISDDDFDAFFGFEPDPVEQAQFDEYVAISRRMADGCSKEYGADLVRFATEQAARDVDAVRAAVGDQKTTYLGYSYGTLLGATYAQLFPNRIRALVLDGAVDPRADAFASSESQAKGFELAFDNFAAWCRRTPQKCPIGPDARASIATVFDKARSSPVRGRDDREATTGLVMYATAQSLYSESGWQKLASALDKLADGDATKVLELSDQYTRRDSEGRYGNFFDAFFAVSCADNPAPISVARVRALQSEWRAKYPLFGSALAVGLLPCAVWPGSRDPYPTGVAKNAPPIVVVGTTGDPATPYEQTAELADMLGVGRVLTWEGEGHTAYPNTECIRNAVNGYLIGLRVPDEGLRCPAQ